MRGQQGARQFTEEELVDPQIPAEECSPKVSTPVRAATNASSFPTIRNVRRRSGR